MELDFNVNIITIYGYTKYKIAYAISPIQKLTANRKHSGQM